MIVAIAALILFGSGVLGGLAWFYVTADRPPELDAATGCPKSGPTAITVVLLDASDELSPQAELQVRNIIEEEAVGVADYSLFELRALAEVPPYSNLLFSRCKPKDGGSAGSIMANPKLEQKNWLNSFKRPLDQVLTNLPTKSEQSASPIMEAMQRIALETFDPNKTTPRTLLVFSDFMEHTDRYSHYREIPSYDSFKGTDAYKDTHTDLGGAHVTLYYLLRRKQVPRGQHLLFWSEWFSDNKGIIDAAEVIQGLQ